jgi:hypothetical protein
MDDVTSNQEPEESNDTKNESQDAVVAESLEQRLIRWANANNLEKSPILLMLLSAIRDGRNLAFWGSVNFMDALPQPRFAGTLERERIAKLLTTVRNVLVFVPVALTWAAISVATSAFGTFSAQNQATTVNFLAFWQDGYGYLAPFWRIGSTAEKVVIIISAVIVLTLIVGRLNNVNDRNYARGMDAAEEQRLAIAMELQNYFHARREINDTTVTETVIESVSGLRDMSRDMSAAMMELRHVMTGILGDTLPRVDGLTNNLKLLGDQAGVKISEMVDSLSEGITTASDLMKTMGQTVTELSHDARDAVDRIIGVENSISAASNELSSAVLQFDSSVGDAKHNLDQGLAGAVDRASISIDNILNEMAVTSTSLKSSSRNVQDQLEELQRSLKRNVLK